MINSNSKPDPLKLLKSQTQTHLRHNKHEDSDSTEKSNNMPTQGQGH